MMVMSRHARLAELAMLAPCRFKQMAGTAMVSRMKNDLVVWISFHLLDMIFRCDKGFGDDTGIQECIR